MLDSLRDQLNWYCGRPVRLPAGTSESRVANMVRRARRRHLLRRARMSTAGEFTFTPEESL